MWAVIGFLCWTGNIDKNIQIDDLILHAQMVWLMYNSDIKGWAIHNPAQVFLAVSEHLK